MLYYVNRTNLELLFPYMESIAEMYQISTPIRKIILDLRIKIRHNYYVT